MKRSKEHFSAETIDEQIDQITNKSSQHQPSVSHTMNAQNATNAQLVQDLQTLAHNETQLLAEIRERLANTYEESRTLKQPMKDTSIQPLRFQAHAEKKQPMKRRMVQLLSGLVAALIIGSVLTILIGNNSHSSHPTPPVPPPDYYAFTNGHLIRVDAKSGAIRWKYTINQADFSVPFIVQGDTVYIVDTTTEYAINNTNGSLRWSKNYLDKITPSSRPIIADSRFYIADNSAHKVDAFTLSDGKLAQSYNVFLDKPSFIAIANNILYTWNDSTILAIKLNNQKILWTQPIVESKHSIALSSALNVYIDKDIFYIEISPSKQSTEKSILALNALTGVKIGQTPLFIPSIPVFEAKGDVIYYTENSLTKGGMIKGSIIHAYNVKIGKEIWQKDFNGIIEGVLSIDDQTVSVYVPDYSNFNKLLNTTITLDARSGTLKWQYSAQQIGNQGTGIMHPQAGQGQAAIYLATSNKASTQIDILTPQGKLFKHITIKN